MLIKRRELLQTGIALSAMAMLPDSAQAGARDAFAPQPNGWNKYELTTRIDILNPSGRVRSWIPLPAFDERSWDQPLSNVWKSNGKVAVRTVGPYGAKMLAVEWHEATKSPFVEVINTVATQDRSVDLTRTSAKPLGADARSLFTAPTRLIPTDGIVKQTADRIVGRTTDDLAKARRIYEWVVANTIRNPKTRGCGLGNIKFMLETGSLGGKCADINALYVGLARAVGLPARDLYGIRVAPSKFGYRSLGANSQDVTKAQHCRAEVYLSDIGWVPVDPADVRKVMLEEPPGHLPPGNPKVEAARQTLFGAWEGNWIGYNDAHDVQLPGSSGQSVAFLMYPQAEDSHGMVDCLAPKDFRYTIHAKRIEA